MERPKGGLLSGVVVLDFTRAVAGSYTTRLLCDMGARILKIEAPEIGDGIRYITVDDPVIGNAMLPTLSPMFIYANAGKQSICLDLKAPEGIEIVRRLVAKVDVVADNFTAHVMPSLGLGYDDLRAIKPDIVMCSLTGFGQEGPLANHVSNDYVGQAMGGMASLARDADGYPMCSGNGIADTMTGTMAAMAIVAALFNRQVSGEGEYIDVSMMDTVMAADCTGQPMYAAARGEYRAPVAPHDHFLLSPWGTYKGPEGRYFSMLTQWDRMSQLMGRPELAADPDFATPAARLKNRDRIHRHIEEYLQSFDTAEQAWQALVDARAAAGMVLDPWEVQTHPQMTTRDMVREVEYPMGKSIPTIATPSHLRNRPISVGRAPFVGEHNRSILRDMLSLDERELDRLHEQGVLYENALVTTMREGHPRLTL